MTTQQQVATAWIYARVLDYCDDRANGIGGSYCQSPYTCDFATIYYDAVTCGVCGDVAVQKLRRRCATLKRNRPSFSSYVVTSGTIRDYLNAKWLKGKNKTRPNIMMVDTLCAWWEGWQILAECCPRDYLSPKSRLTRVKAELKQWIKSTS